MKTKLKIITYLFQICGGIMLFCIMSGLILPLMVSANSTIIVLLTPFIAIVGTYVSVLCFFGGLKGLKNTINKPSGVK